ncbi:hypothetical protein PR001_g27852, partial [Phytophthora rubi]
MLQEWSEERYMKEFKCLGTRQPPDVADAADPELVTLAVQLSHHAYRLVRDQYQYACSADAAYEISINGTTAMLLTKRGNSDHTVHEVNTKTFQCNCRFMRTLLLPCRHVIYFRKHQSCESDIPPPKFYTARWSLLSPTNDISTGHLDVERSLRTVKRNTKTEGVPSRDQKYSSARAVCQQIQSIMAEQSTEDFKSTFALIKTVEKLCRTGEVRKLADAMAVIESQAPESEPKKPRHHMQRVQASSEANMTQLRFSESAKKTQISRRKKNKSQKVQTLQRIRRRAKLLSTGKSKTDLTLEELGSLLEQLYCYALVAKTLELFRLKEVQVHASHKIQRMNVGQPHPQPEGILSREVCTAAISEIDMRVEGKEGNALYLARWDDFGYVTIEQLRAMVLVIDAMVAMTKVEAALKWIDMVAICSSAEEPPFNDCASYPKEVIKDCVENMALNTYTTAGEDIEGVRLLDFCGKKWLSSTCVRAGLIFLARHYVMKNVGFILPDWYPFEEGPRRN